MIDMDVLGVVAGMVPAAIAIDHLCHSGERARWRSVAFWGLFAVTVMAGPVIPDVLSGAMLLCMVGLAAAGLKPGPVATTSPEERRASAKRFGYRLLWPALCVPIVTLTIALLASDGKVAGVQVIHPRQVTLAALAAGAIAAFAIAAAMLRPPARAFASETRRLGDAVGWAILLPQMLAALGGIFASAGVGTVVGDLASRFLPLGTPLLSVATYCLGMAAFTVVMGNAFAAFPVMTAGIGLPVVIGQFGGNPAVVTALGMLSGFCGTLMSPMAANFNLVPAAILELPDRFGVIKAQFPTALLMLLVNIAVMYLCAF